MKVNRCNTDGRLGRVGQKGGDFTVFGDYNTVFVIRIQLGHPSIGIGQQHAAAVAGGNAFGPHHKVAQSDMLLCQIVGRAGLLLGSAFAVAHRIRHRRRRRQHNRPDHQPDQQVSQCDTLLFTFRNHKFHQLY